MEEAMGAFGDLPEWFSQVVFSGGTGLISPGKTAITTVKLDPGYYIMECYVRMPDGRFHTSMGMARELIVLEQDSGLRPPEFNIQIDIRGQSGISWNGDPRAGKTVFRVEYVDQMVHENFVGHDRQSCPHGGRGGPGSTRGLDQLGHSYRAYELYNA